MAFFNKPAGTTQISNYNPQQISALNQLLQQGLSGVQNQNKFDFTPIEQQARSGFASKTVPLLAERFGSLAGESRGSSGLMGQLSGAGAELEQGLASMKSQYGLQGQQQQNQLHQLLLQLGLTPQNENIFQPEQPGFLETAGSSILSILPLLLSLSGGAVGGPAGAVAGGGLGALLNR